jgi:rod shape-determining protein MreD
MMNTANGSLWAYRGLFIAVAMLLIFLRILPLSHQSGALPGPDVLLTLTLAWVVRRQDYVPIWLIAAVFLTEDIITMRPPGLWCALVVIACEFLRMRAVMVRELNFAAEWALVSGVMLAMLIVYRILFAITFMPQVTFGFALVQVLWSIATYPLVVLITRYVLALHKPSMGEVDAYGRRF